MTCVTCGSYFPTLNLARKTCSNNCARIRNNERKRARNRGEYLRKRRGPRKPHQQVKFTRPEAQGSREDFLRYVVEDVEDMRTYEVLREALGVEG